MHLAAAWAFAQFTHDPDDLAPIAQRLENAGFDGLAINDHVVGGSPERARPGETVHTIDTPSTDPFVMLAMLGAVTRRVTLTTEILILPQRQTVLVAKQAAELDRLTGGRLRLGVGVGRNWIEYEALNEDFSTRGARMEEQIDVLRRLWTDDLVTFTGRWHTLDRVGLNPKPLQRPIPIWMGSFVGAINERVLQRTARLADGWLPQYPPGDEFAALLARFRRLVADAGRGAESVTIQAVSAIRPDSDPARWRSDATWFADHGIDHLIARGSGFATAADHVDALLHWKDTIRG